MKLGKPQTGMSLYQPPYISFCVFTCDQYKIEFRLRLISADFVLACLHTFGLRKHS